jgi:hypothetical protein
MQIKRTNPASFTPRYWTYRKLRNDIWGNLAYLNKKNSFFRLMKKYALVQLKRRIRKLRYKKRIYILKAFRIRKHHRTADYSVTKKKPMRLKKPLKFRASLQVLRLKLLAFYGFKLRRKPMRKLFVSINKGVGKNSISRPNAPFASGRRQINSVETRVDVMLYRAGFTTNVYEGRRFIREKKAFVMEPATHKGRFFHYYNLKSYYHKVPLFNFITLRYDLALRRKITLRHMIWARKLICYPPHYLLVDYRTMIGLRHIDPSTNMVRYPFPGTLAYFVGLAIYF